MPAVCAKQTAGVDVLADIAGRDCERCRWNGKRTYKRLPEKTRLPPEAEIPDGLSSGRSRGEPYFHLAPQFGSGSHSAT
jgi:hypothetical protein